MATVLNIIKKRGDTRRHTFIVQDENGVVVDISGWTAFVLTVTSDSDPIDGTSLIEAMTGVLAINGTDGRISFSPAGTLAVGSHYYDAQALDSNAEKITFAEGKYKVDQDRGKA